MEYQKSGIGFMLSELFQLLTKMRNDQKAPESCGNSLNQPETT